MKTSRLKIDTKNLFSHLNGHSTWRYIFLCIFSPVLFLPLFFSCKTAEAAEIQVNSGWENSTSVTVKIGDMGFFRPVYTQEMINQADADSQYGDGNFTQSPETGADGEYFTYFSNDTSVLSVNADGSYYAAGAGTAEVEIEGYTAAGNLFFEGECEVAVLYNMDSVTLDTDRLSGSVLKVNGQIQREADFSLQVKSDYILSEMEEGVSFQMDSSNPDVEVYGELYRNEISIHASGSGKTKLTITINEKAFTVLLEMHTIGITKNSFLMAAGEEKQMKIKGTDKKLKWSSDNPSRVSVNSKGLLKAKKPGNIIIRGSYGDCKFSCIVCVTSPQKKKAVLYARRIAAGSTYSQPKRMQDGYYDCSSLVWKSYTKAGKTLVSSSYAPTAADLAKVLVQQGRRVKGGLCKGNVAGRKLLAGDLLFEGGENNGRYRGIYHVEMFAGYFIYGYDTEGNPYLGCDWANRQLGSVYYKTDIVCRP